MAYLHRALPRLQHLASHLPARSSSVALRISSPPPRVSNTALVASQRAQHRAMATSYEVPKTMKGVIVEQTGGVEVLQYKTDIPIPTPKEGEILVKNEVCGINFIDTYGRLIPFSNIFLTFFASFSK